MPWCDTDAMAAHLIEISAAVDPGAHAVLIVDQAGWHLTPKLAIPDNITVLALPPRSPELNPVENVWCATLVVEPDLQILRRHRRAVLPSLVIDQPWKIMFDDLTRDLRTGIFQGLRVASTIHFTYILPDFPGYQE